MDISEETLIQGCIKQERRFQKLLYDRYCAAMFTIAVRLCVHYEDAEDALQEAFLEVFKHIHEFRKESTLGAWIKKIVVRTALKKNKKSSQRQDIQILPLTFCDFDNLIEKQTDMEYLEKCILSLPQKSRQIFVLAEIEGYSHEEIAELLQISVGTSKSQLHYAKQLLKQKLEPILK
ncbi:MAG: RNA polymerase sigma factor [Bacteroidia bacterium]|nr:RNA polymerase sigma factor [Bacteroidia bacterium]MDW8346488.1 RNA polymerase sigma factor [Bacteroidia bacterium]